MRSILFSLLLLSATAQAAELTPGRGLFFRYDAKTLQADGYPDRQHASFFWRGGVEGNWGILYDEDNVPYGPNTYFHWEEPLDHPYFAMTDSTLEGRWFVMNRPAGMNPAQHGHFMELLDLSYHDLCELLDTRPTTKIHVFGASTLEEYRALTGHDFWVPMVADATFILVCPTDVLDRRTLLAHTARAAVAKSLLNWKCHGGLPPWLREGLVSYLSEEGNELLNYVNFYRPHLDSVLWPVERVNQNLVPLTGDGSLGRVAQYNAFLMTWHLAETFGFARVRQVLDILQEGRSFAAAVQEVYGRDEDALIKLIDPRTLGEPITEPRFHR
jgi:hypothetical protein